MAEIDPILGAMQSASSGMSAQSLRMRLATENLSNADTPGYQRKLATFQAEAGGVELGRVFLD